MVWMMQPETAPLRVSSPKGIENTTGIETFATASDNTMTHAESLNAFAEVAENDYDKTSA